MFKTILLTLAIFLLPTYVFPQHDHSGHSQNDEVSDSLTHKYISEITVQGILANKLNFPYQMIPGEEVVSHGFVTPANALHHVPGVALNRDAIWATSVNIRGFF